MENPIAEDPVNEHKVLNFKPKAKTKTAETSLSSRVHGIAVVTEINGTRPISVVLNEISYKVTHYLSSLLGVEPGVQLGDEVLISAVAGGDGVMIHGVMSPYTDKPPRSSFSIRDDKLVIEAQGAVILKCGTSTIELTEAGEICINGKDVRTVADKVRTDGKEIRTIAKKMLTLQGSKIDFN